MRVASPGRPHLSYCTNIHPGESLGEVRAALESHAVAVKRRLGVRGAFGIGARLSARAATELERPGALEEFRELLARHGLYVFTINGFPYGAFHGERVKEAVYRPDWREPERVAYTDGLARLLSQLVPDGVHGSISTVPVAFRSRATPADAPAVVAHLLEHAKALFTIRERTGKLVELALEPEPCCFLETTDDAVCFFEEYLFSRPSVQRFAQLAGIDEVQAADFLRRHLGVCLDACHLAVEFETATGALSRIESAGIRIGKVQVTTALRAELSGDPGADEGKLVALERFAEGVYLHQVVEQRDGMLVRHLDLPECIAEARAAGLRGPAEWRIHFHVPVFAERLDPFTSTQPFLRDLLAIAAEKPISEHFEVETYTWDVLPEEHRLLGVDDAIGREIEWTRAQLAPSQERRAAP
jgi:sugar phosphate isomerase/epimerase